MKKLFGYAGLAVAVGILAVATLLSWDGKDEDDSDKYGC
ncbi:MAG: hypothetical protein UW95_C0030G0004 [Parcubacteria group bacterium GW2011_GWC1_45_14]|nr:MAG: hypothetical protein UW87_C0015G0007 [Candidatus Moranbacteria bacterium GW2011_GWC2_45_10]KKT92689.1 MAG: hypothetical protein UW95_C0030G0004 [Parcubacteria group bacterium GW2011_GWC1_45_14]